MKLYLISADHEIHFHENGYKVLIHSRCVRDLGMNGADKPEDGHRLCQLTGRDNPERDSCYSGRREKDFRESRKGSWVVYFYWWKVKCRLCNC